MPVQEVTAYTVKALGAMLMQSNVKIKEETFVFFLHRSPINFSFATDNALCAAFTRRWELSLLSAARLQMLAGRIHKSLSSKHGMLQEVFHEFGFVPS